MDLLSLNQVVAKFTLFLIAPKRKKAKQRNTPSNWEKFRKLRNSYTNTIKEAKSDYESKLADRLCNAKPEDSKIWWKTLKYFNGNNKSDNISEQPLLINNKCVDDLKEKANAFNKFFVDQGKLEISDNDLRNLSKPIAPAFSLEKIELTVKDIEDILKSIDTSKATGPDGVSPKMLKATANTIAPILTCIFQKSIETCCFPEDWKIANVTPLHKKDEKELVTNYRPISLLSCIGKILEKCVFKNVMNFFRENNVLTEAQAAYIGQGSSTVTQLTEIYNEVLNNLEKGINSYFAFLDASKAFDRVWHAGVLFKLEQCGITGPLLKWFENYLENRKQKVVLNGEESSTLNITSGVPQGSILGPLLFLVYVNDLPTDIISNVKMYADDTSLVLPSKDINTARDTLNEDLNTLDKWAKQWHVIFNPGKTVSMTITRKVQEEPLNLVMNNTNIKQVASHKHLGVTIQSNCKWTDHIKEITQKASKKVDQLRSLMHKLDRNTLQKMYFTFVRPLLEYADIVWCNCADKEKKMIEDVQLAAARVITSATKGTSHEIIYENCKWELMEERRKSHRLTMIYKMKNGLCPSQLCALLPSRVRDRVDYNLRNRNNLSKPISKTNALSKSFIPKGVDEWNSLSPEKRESPTLSRFKRVLKKPKHHVKPRFLVGNRTGQIMHSRMKLKCSGLNEDLHKNHIEESSECACGYYTESAEHYLLNCRKYDQIRANMFVNIPEEFRRNIETLMDGDDTLSEGKNKQLFEAINAFIVASKRFTR